VPNNTQINNMPSRTKVINNIQIFSMPSNIQIITLKDLSEVCEILKLLEGKSWYI